MPEDHRSDAPTKLFKILAKNASSQKKMPQKMISGLFIKTWNQWVSKKSRKVLRYDPVKEKDPEYVGNKAIREDK